MMTKRPVPNTLKMIFEVYSFVWRDRVGLLWAMVVPLAAYFLISIIRDGVDSLVAFEWPNATLNGAIYAAWIVDAVFLVAVHRRASAREELPARQLAWRIGGPEVRYFIYALVIIRLPLIAPFFLSYLSFPAAYDFIRISTIALKIVEIVQAGSAIVYTDIGFFAAWLIGTIIPFFSFSPSIPSRLVDHFYRFSTIVSRFRG